VQQFDGAQGLRQPVRELSVDQDEDHLGGLVAAVLPAMAGAALDDHVAGVQRGLGAVVEDQDHLAGDDDAVVDRFGPVHGGDHAGRERVDPDLGAVGGRRHGNRAVGRVRLGGGQRGRGGRGGPQLVEAGAVRRRARDRGRSVGQEY
jgi:hypothetical protein